jgi:hypothetical protein
MTVKQNRNILIAEGFFFLERNRFEKGRRQSNQDPRSNQIE